MKVEVRGFNNSDIPAICAIWNEHYANTAPETPLNAFRLEVFGLAKPYFVHEHILVSKAIAKSLAFSILAPLPIHLVETSNPTRWGFCSLCQQDPNQAASVELLLQHFEQEAIQRGVRRCVFRPPLPNSAYYLGIGPADSIAGVLAQEVDLCDWLARAGFTPSSPTCLWELDLDQFQAPVDRMQIQIRRAAAVNQQLDEPVLPWWQACVLGHTEPTKFQLVHRTEKRVLCDALFWTLSTELKQSHLSTTWLWPTSFRAETEDVTDDHWTFLLAESLRQCQADRIQTVRTAAFADEDDNNSTLRRLGFRPLTNGMIFQREFGTE